MKIYKKLLTALFLSVVCVLTCFGFAACDMGGNSETNGGEPTHHHEFLEVPSPEFLAEEATCGHRAVYYKSCECGLASGETFEYGDYAHFFGGWIEESPANCYADENGTLGHYTCESCGGWFDKNGNQIYDLNILPTHEYVWVDSTPPQENKHGSKGHYRCSNCGNYFDENNEKIGDTDVIIHCYSEDDWVEEVPAKCEKAGTEGYYYCSACNGYFDKNGKFISWYLSSLTIKAKGHEYENGYCKNCGNKTPSVGLAYEFYQDNINHSRCYFYITGMGTCTDTEVVIPSTLTAEDGYEYPVQAIAEKAFSGCSNLTSITIPASLTHIGDQAFYNCTNLTKVNYTGTVDDWASITFVKGTYSCSANPLYYANNLYINNELVTQATITVSQVNPYAFYGCYSLTSVTLESSVKTISSYAFSRCFKLAEVINKTGKDITTWESSYINNYALNVKTEGETDIKKVDDFLFLTADNTNYLVNYVGNDSNLTLPENYNGNDYVINSRAFAYCHTLTSVTIPDNYKSIIGESAFCTCKNLTNVTIGNGVTEVKGWAFLECSKLSTVTIGDNVTSIGEDAFVHCYNLVSIVLGKNVQSIDEDAFYGCLRLVEVVNNSTYLNYIQCGSENYGKIGYYALAVTTGFRKIDNQNGYIFYKVNGIDYLVNYVGNEKSLTLPSGEYKINDYAFNERNDITSVTIPDGVTSIGNYAFNGCSKLTSVTIGKRVVSIGNYAFNECSILANLKIGDSVESIGNYAFYKCSDLTSVIIPDNVTSIGKSAFCSCYDLTSVTIGSSVQSISWWDFVDCYRLVEIINKSKYITIEKGKGIASDALSVKTEGTTDIEIIDGLWFLTVDNVKYLVNYVGNETELTLPEGNYKINDYAFYGRSSLTSVTIPDGVTSIGNYSFGNCTYLENVTIIGSSVVSIGDYAFQNCYYLTNINIPDSVKSIGKYAFHHCKITSITIPDGVTSIGDYTFCSCGSLTSITIPDSVTSIGNYAFYNCSSLTNINIPESVTSIGNYAFYECYSLVSITIPTGVTSIGSGSFYCCYNLASITIPGSVISIGDSAFGSCYELESVYYNGTEEEWNNIEIENINNSYLENATKYFYSEETPTTSGNYWHYVNGVPTVWE